MSLTISCPMDPMVDQFDDDLEAIFIEETFHTCEPIREKPVKTVVERVWIRERRKKGLNGIKCEFKSNRKTIAERFAELMDSRRVAGVVFATDVDEEEDSDDEEFVDIEDETTNEELAISSMSSGLTKQYKRNLTINLAKKLKDRAIAVRLGLKYRPKKAKLRVKDKVMSWSQKFGRLLAAKKLIDLPLLYKKYISGPMKSKQELDIEIDLYMAEVKNKKKLKMAFDDITEAANSADNTDTNSGFTVVDTKNLFGGFGGPGWRKRISLKEPKPKPDKDELDMDLDRYMKPKSDRVEMDMDSDMKPTPDRDELDMDLDLYMSNK